MKVTCPACNASYRLPDEKIQGKNRIFKMSCKRCSAEIRVRGVETEEEVGRTTMPFALEMPVPVAAQAPTPVWFAGIEGRQVGPLTESEIVDHIHQGRLTAQDLVWRKGFSAWLPAREVAPFDELVADVAEHATATAKKPRRAQTLELSAAMIELLVKLDGQSEQGSDNAGPVAAAEPPALPVLDDDAEGMPPVPTEARVADRPAAIAGNLAAVAAAEQIAETTIAPMPDDVIVELPPRTSAGKKEGAGKVDAAAKTDAAASKAAGATPSIAAAEPALPATAQLEIKKADLGSGKKAEQHQKAEQTQRPDGGKKPELAKVEKIAQVDKSAGDAAPSIKIRLPDSGVQPAEQPATADSIPTDKGKRTREDAATNVNLPTVSEGPTSLPSLAQQAATPLAVSPMVKPLSATVRPSPTIGKPQISPGPITTQSKPSLSKTEPPRAATAKAGDRKSDASKVGAKKGNGMFLLLGGGVAVVAFAVIAVLATGGKKTETTDGAAVAAAPAASPAPAEAVATADILVAAAPPVEASPDVQVAVATADVSVAAVDIQVPVAQPDVEQAVAVADKPAAIAGVGNGAETPAAAAHEEEMKKVAEKKEVEKKEAEKKEVVEKKDDKKAEKKEEKVKEEKKVEVKEEKKDPKADKKGATKDDLDDLVGKGKKEKKVEEPKVKEEPPPEKKKSKGGDDDEIDRILNKQKEKGGAKKGADEDESGGISADQIKAVGAKAGQKVIRCYMLNADADGSEETIKVNVFVAPDGSVTNAKVAGKYASGPLGKCISDAVKALTFPASGGGTKKYTLTYKAGG